MAFKPIQIPLIQGEDTGTSTGAVGGGPGRLVSVTDGVFTRSGAITARPGGVSRSDATLAAMAATYAAGGLAANAVGPLAQFHGRLAASNGGTWTDVGPVWSVKRETLPALVATGGSPYAAALYQSIGGPVGAYQGDVAEAMAAFGFTENVVGPFPQAAPYVNDVPEPVKAVGSTLGPVQPLFSAVDDVVFAINLAGTTGLYAWSYTSATATLLATDSSTSTPTARTWNTQRLWAVRNATDSNYYVAYYTDASTIRVSKVSPALAVLSSFTVPVAAGSDAGPCAVGLDCKGTKGVVAFVSGAATATVTAYNFNASTMSAGTSASVTQASLLPAGGALGVTCSLDATGATAYVTWQAAGSYSSLLGNNGAAYVATWATSGSPVLTPILRLDGSGTVAGHSVSGTWATLFPATPWVGGRWVAGFQWHNIQPVTTTYEYTAKAAGAATWYAVDVTDDTGLGTVVACGEIDGSTRLMRPGKCYVDTSSRLVIPVLEGVTFSTQTNTNTALVPAQATDWTQVETGVFRPVRLTAGAAPYAQLDGRTLLGGNVPYYFDGTTATPAGFVEQPKTSVTTSTSGGTLPAGSYTVSAVWTHVDAGGRVMRSLPADLATIATTGSTSSVTIGVNTPALGWTYPANTFTQSPVSVKFYVSTTTPAAGAPLYLVGSAQVYTGFGTSLTVTSVPQGTEEELYTTGGVLANDVAPSDRGLVVCDNRVWAADEFNLYPSHVLTANTTVAWNLEEFVIPVPTSYGRVVGLGTYDETVVAVCERGVMTVGGPGYDETGLNGSGWTNPSLAYAIGAGPSASGSARRVVSAPSGVFWLGPDGLAYNLSRAGAGQVVGHQEAGFTGGTELAYQAPAATEHLPSNPMLVVGGTVTAVMDLAVGQWSTWLFGVGGHAPVSWAPSATGLYEWLDDGTVYSLDGWFQDDPAGPFDTVVQTAYNPTLPDGPALQWSRVRSVNPVYTVASANHAVTFAVLVGAREGAVTTSKSATVTPGAFGAPTNWPYGVGPEFRTTVQRAGSFWVRLTVTRCWAVELNAIELWVDGGSDRAPARNRS